MPKQNKIIESSPTPHLDTWCVGRPYLIQWLGLLIAYAAADITFGLNAVRDGAMRRTIQPPEPLDLWFALYETEGIFSMFGSITEAIVKDMVPRDSNPSTEPKTTDAEFMAAMRDFATLMNASTATPVPTTSGDPGDNPLAKITESIRKFFGKIRQSPTGDTAIVKQTELAFLATVWLPYFLKNQNTPDELFAKASQGDLGAISQLVRYDPWIIYAPDIQKHIMAASTTRRAAYQRIMKSATLHPYRKYSKWAVKSDLGGFLLAAAKSLGYNLTKTDVVQLFDAYTQDTQKNPHAEDTDIPRTDQEAYRKQLYRRRAYWTKLLARETDEWLKFLKQLSDATGTKQNQEMSEK